MTVEHTGITERRAPRLPLRGDRVPVLPPGVTYLMKALNDDNLGFREIATAVEKVPSVAARLLALANSAWSAPASPVIALDMACGRLGMQVVRTASIAIAVSQPFNPARCPAFDAQRFWSSALMNADAAYWLADQTSTDQSSAARTAGLLSNLGLLWLAESLPAETAQALQATVDAPGGDLENALLATCGVGYAEAGALLAESWQLPPILTEAIAGQVQGCRSDNSLCRIVYAATQLVSEVRREHSQNLPLPPLERIGITSQVQQTVFDRSTAAKAATFELADALFP